ncbi:phage baseplate protein [Candidatus Nitrospira bockiana]
MRAGSSAVHVPSAGELLDVWEAGQSLPPVQRALALLMLARPDVPHERLAERTIGRRDADLLSLREYLFGPLIVALAHCPGCLERFEWRFTTDDIRMSEPEDEVFHVQADRYVVRARAANSLDLLSADTACVSAPDRAVIVQCILEARRDDAPVAPEELPDAVVNVVADRMSEADPQAEVSIAMRCPACAHEWQALFDVAAFLWRELGVWATRALDEVHTIASAYGWTEHEILAMSAARRQRYVSMIEQSR